MSDVAIRVEGLGKRYRIGASRRRERTVRAFLRRAALSPFDYLRSTLRGPSEEEILWALRDVSFEVGCGEVIGIIGANGAGKSTLLKILARITEPTEGRAELHGRIGSLLEVGTGFHPELTGRENIFFSGTILGMKRREIRAQFDEIVDFSGVEKFIDTPVKRYSSGMRVRLGFAVAAHLRPEILLIDEVLAVGDAEFQKKCLGKMGDVAKGGRTVLFVSHNMGAIRNLCARACLIDSGRLTMDGEPRSVIDHYTSSVLPARIESACLRDAANRSGSGSIRLTRFHVERADGTRPQSVSGGADVTFVFGYECAEGAVPRAVDVGLSLHCADRTTLCVLYRSYVAQPFQAIPTRGEFRCCVPKLPLAPGRYLVAARVTAGGVEADWLRDGAGYVDVEAGDFYGTGHKGPEPGVPVLIAGDWSVDEGVE